MTTLNKIVLSELSSLQLDSVLNKFQLTAPDSYDEDGKRELLRSSKVFTRGIGNYDNDNTVAVFNNKGTFVDFESVDGTVKGIFAKSESGKVMYPCSVCCKEVTDKSDTSGRGIECSGCGWYFHTGCTDKPISLDLFKALTNSPSYIKVLCPPCNSVYGSALSKLKRVESKVDAMAVKVNNVESKVKQVANKSSYSAAVSNGISKHSPIPQKVMEGLKSISKAKQETDDVERLKRTRVVIRPEDTNIRTSREIRKAFNQHYQGMVIKHCRLTASRSITFEFENENTAKTVQSNWKTSHFGGNKGMKIPGDYNTVGMVKHVYDDHKEDDMKKDIMQNYPGLVTKCEFQQKRSDKSFNGMIKLEFSSREAMMKVITDKIKLCHQRYIVEEYKRKSRVIKCNKCQGWGHIHRYCTKSAKCGKCAENHESNSCSITSGFKCAHCNEDHQAGSFDCAVYKEKLAKFSHDSL